MEHTLYVNLRFWPVAGRIIGMARVVVKGVKSYYYTGAKKTKGEVIDRLFQLIESDKV